jgi:hypothetical protein
MSNHDRYRMKTIAQSFFNDDDDDHGGEGDEGSEGR